MTDFAFVTNYCFPQFSKKELKYLLRLAGKPRSSMLLTTYMNGLLFLFKVVGCD